MLLSYLNTTSLNLPPAAPTSPGHPTNATTTFTFSTFQLVHKKGEFCRRAASQEVVLLVSVLTLRYTGNSVHHSFLLQGAS